MPPQVVRVERTGWRDSTLSDRHRKWGIDCPMVDIDFLALEFDNRRASAIVEYKHERAAPQHASQPCYQALVDLGNRAGLPVFSVRYKEDFSCWSVVPLNTAAHTLVPQRIDMTERDWVALLYKLRGRPLPESLFGAAQTENRTAGVVSDRCGTCDNWYPDDCTCSSAARNEALQISDCGPLRTDR